MRPPRLLVVLFCLIFFPIFLTILSALSSDVVSPDTLSSQTPGLHALFSFNIPTSLFPPSAIISLTDDNSTFFLTRPAAFGSMLPVNGMSGQLWVGSGFGEGGLAAGAEGELGCSDIPGWGEDNPRKKPDTTARGTDPKSGKSRSGTTNDGIALQNYARLPSQPDVAWQNGRSDAIVSPSSSDGTDDHLHHPLSESSISDAITTQKYGDYVQNKQSTHADIQSLQETAEIQGKVVLLSRGGCGFLEKVKWAQRRGAIAVIVGDDTRGGNLVTMYARGDTSNVTIPSLFTSYTTAHLLSSLIPGHSGANSALGDAIKSSQSKTTGTENVDTQKVTTTTTSASTATPTQTSNYQSKERPVSTSKSNSGFFRKLGSIFGLCSNSGSSKSSQDSRRPPSSGNIDWMTNPWDKSDTQNDHSKGATDSTDRNRGKLNDDLKSKNDGLVSSDELNGGDDFVIGVHDWRDADLMLPRSSTSTVPSSSVTGKDNSKTSVIETDVSSNNLLRGGSITPGSGEYQSIDKQNGKTTATNVKVSGNDRHSSKEGSDLPEKGWFASHFGWGDNDKALDTQPSLLPSLQNIATTVKTQDKVSPSSPPVSKVSEHEGLWVTLTPASMSTSPFFDTLLVLVISPLLTLTVVYALLLLRSRIRRRRWRAPKSVIERLPVRTYHTLSTSSSSSSLGTSNPGPVSQTSPLLGNEIRPNTARPARSRSQTISGVVSTPREKLAKVQSGSILWRRKYTGRQVECVVCLEEYVDGQSQVMSLPCGHEFHAECITPWLTTRRRTCPICKGDVVRSMTQPQGDDMSSRQETENYRPELDSNDDTSVPFLITVVNEDHTDTEQNAGLDLRASSAPQSNWRNLASLSFSALNGDMIWHQARADRNR
ncbi:hypothetical protein N7495_008482 [Penicillium taxi]|uniref:uncharacterized protein n=1 Tax=Penicillium taxi TaxID=168475 RepID=UPI0025452F2A|nr:uncharacterized protein N7495_008482 [Penicillium taxi]KAJ5888441.1 hypothetical protein N7495_008482 [Penicillium taxi]